jgi:hypothetical protein
MYLLKLECIGDNVRAQTKFYTDNINSLIPGLGSLAFGDMPDRYFVYEIWYERKNYDIKKRKLYPKKDYTKANSVGSRGVYAFYFLENGKVYEVKKPTSWKSSDHYFCRIENNQEVKMSAEETIKWLRNT